MPVKHFIGIACINSGHADLSFGESSRAAAEVIIRGGADDSANEALSLKRTSTKMPLMLVLMQLAQASHKLGVRLALTWRPRDYPADDLTNEDFAKFTLRGLA